MEDILICQLDVLNEVQRARHGVVLETLRQSLIETRELADGFAFCYPPALLPLAAEFVSRERLCCPFFNFKLELAADNGPLWLHLTGRQGVKAFLQAELVGSGEWRVSPLPTPH